MKKFLLFSVASLVAFYFSSCTKESTPVYNSYGILNSTGSVTTISTDKGNTLTVSNPSLSAYNNKRVYVEYNILKDAKPNFEVELYWIDSLLTKSIIDTVGLTQRAQDSIGYDPISTRYAQFSGNYLMLNFVYKRYDYTTRHFVNAVGYKSVTQDTVHITLRHNDQAPDNTSYYGYSHGFINLELNSWVPSGKEQVVVYLYNYIDNQSVLVDNGIYKRNAPATTMMGEVEIQDLGNY